MKMMITYDGSEASQFALKESLKMARSMGAELTLYTCVEVMNYYAPVSIEGASQVWGPTMEQGVKEYVKEVGDKLTEEAQEICQGAEISYTHIVEEGQPRENICNFAQENQIDLLVVGSRGLGVIKRMLLGSVSQYVINHAPCSVLVMRPKGA